MRLFIFTASLLIGIVVGIIPTNDAAAQACKSPITYGQPTLHCKGETQISGVGCPSIGNSKFEILVKNAVPKAQAKPVAGFLWGGFNKALLGLPCANRSGNLSLNLVTGFGPFNVPIDANGIAKLPAPIPNFAGLVGLKVYFQFFEFHLHCFPCFIAPPFAGFSATKGLEMLIQMPPCIKDSFSLSNGSLPNPAIWVRDATCSMRNPHQTIQNGTLELYGQRHYPSNCKFWGSGVGVYTRATFSNFDVAVQYIGQKSGGPNGGGGLIIRDAARLPPSKFKAFYAGATFSWASLTVTVSDGTGRQRNLGSPFLKDGDVIQIKGSPGGSLDFYINGKLRTSFQNWRPPVSRFVASLHSAPGGTNGEQRYTWYDNFRLCVK